MKSLLMYAALITASLSSAVAQPLPTNKWVSFWGDSSRINSGYVSVGTVIRAYSPHGVLCGQFVVKTAGSYGMMPVYLDDPTTPSVEEGAQAGDTIHFTVNGIPAAPLGSKVPVWTSNGDVQKVNLAVEYPEISLSSAAIPLGPVKVKSSVSDTLIITNTGLKSLKIDSIKAVYHPQKYLTVSVSAATLGPGDKVSVVIKFSPEYGSGNVSLPLIIYSNAGTATELSVPLTATVESDVTPANEWVSLWGDAATLDGVPLAVGNVVDAYTTKGIHCGTFTVTEPGKYGLMPVYRDDSTTAPVIEGAAPGDSLIFLIDGYHASPAGPDRCVWTSFGAILKVNLRASTLQRPSLVGPSTDSVEAPVSLALSWKSVTGAASYRLQLSKDSSFSAIVLDSSGITSTSLSVAGLPNNTKYYWHINASNSGGSSDWSNIWSFTTERISPSAPELLSPSGTVSEPRRSIFCWKACAFATQYRLQVAKDESFTTIVYDTTLADTSKKLSLPLEPSTVHYWRVEARDTKGRTVLSGVAHFTTGTGIDAIEDMHGLPKEFALYQNYPNPFNPSTRIRFDLMKASTVTFVIFNILGQTVEYWNYGMMAAGRYERDLDMSGHATGVYFYRIIAAGKDGESFVAIKRMMVIK